jgi:hypothetical protein
LQREWSNNGSLGWLTHGRHGIVEWGRSIRFFSGGILEPLVEKFEGKRTRMSATELKEWTGSFDFVP